MVKTQPPSSLMFKVNRLSPELIVPAKPTPREFKLLSELDNSFRSQIPMLFIYPHDPSMNGVDLVKLIKKAISQTLVYYYPFAGRLREDPDSGKLVVECTGEGVLFIEADADVTLDRFGYPLAPTFPCYDQFVFDVPGSSDIINCPLFLFQMTRLKCGGIIIGTRLNHCMCDAAGHAQFMASIAEMAKGATFLSVLPKWERHLLNYNPNNLQQVTSSDPENLSTGHFYDSDLCHRTFLFERTKISDLRRLLPLSFSCCSSFEIIVACVWRCRVLALASNLMEEETARLIWPINLRKKSYHVKVPAGYYGNALVYAIVKSTVREIMHNPFSFVLHMVKNGREIVPEDPNKSGWTSGASITCYTVTDVRTVGYEEVDFGWGKPRYVGPPFCPVNTVFHLPFSDQTGEKGIMVPVCLPAKSMEIFEKELNSIFEGLPRTCVDHKLVKSKL